MPSHYPILLVGYNYVWDCIKLLCFFSFEIIFFCCLLLIMTGCNYRIRLDKTIMPHALQYYLMARVSNFQQKYQVRKRRKARKNMCTRRPQVEKIEKGYPYNFFLWVTLIVHSEKPLFSEKTRWQTANRKTNIHAVRTSGEKFISSLHCDAKKEKSKRVPELGRRELTDLSPDVLIAWIFVFLLYSARF